MPNNSTHASLQSQWSHAWFRAEAARAVCGSFHPPAVAVCFWGNRSPQDPGIKHAVIGTIAATGVVVWPVWVAERAACAMVTGANATLDIEHGHRWALLRLWPFCFYSWGPEMKLKTVPATAPGFSLESCVRSVVNTSNMTSDYQHQHQHQRSQRELQRLEQPRHQQQLQHQSPVLAIGLGGLARTLAHPLVYKSLRGHVVDGLGAQARTVVFGALRLTDDRVISTFAGR